MNNIINIINEYLYNYNNKCNIYINKNDKRLKINNYKIDKYNLITNNFIIKNTYQFNFNYELKLNLNNDIIKEIFDFRYILKKKKEYIYY